MFGNIQPVRKVAYGTVLVSNYLPSVRETSLEDEDDKIIDTK